MLSCVSREELRSQIISPDTHDIQSWFSCTCQSQSERLAYFGREIVQYFYLIFATRTLYTTSILPAGIQGVYAVSLNLHFLSRCHLNPRFPPPIILPFVQIHTVPYESVPSLISPLPSCHLASPVRFF